MSFLAQITPFHHPLPYHYAVFLFHQSSTMSQHQFFKIFQIFSNFSHRVYFREYCSRNYVSNELRMSDSDWLNIIADDSLPSPRTKRKSKFFGCIPPESGSTIFQAWWWDVYNPNLDFTRDSRKENQRKMDQMKVKSSPGVA